MQQKRRSSWQTRHLKEPFLRSKLISVFTNTLANACIPAIDLATRYLELDKSVLATAAEEFAEIGVAVSGFSIESIALTEDVEKHVDKRSSMNVIGDLDQYSKYQAAEAIPVAAANPGGLAGLGASFVLGQEIAKAMGVTVKSAESVSEQSAAPQDWKNTGRG